MPTRSSSPKTPVLRRAEGPRDRGVGVLDVEAAGDRLAIARRSNGAEPVGDEARRVLAAHDGLAEALVGAGVDASARVVVGDHLEQPQVARRVEEVRDAQSAAAEPLGSAERDGRGVGGDDRARGRARPGRRRSRLTAASSTTASTPSRSRPGGRCRRRLAGRDPPRVGRLHEAPAAAPSAAARPPARAPPGTMSSSTTSSPALASVRGDARAHRRRRRSRRPAATRRHSTASSSVAMPWPPPMHWVATRVAPAGAAQQLRRLAGDARAGGAERVAERDRAAVDVDARPGRCRAPRSPPRTATRTPR